VEEEEKEPASRSKRPRRGRELIEDASELGEDEDDMPRSSTTSRRKEPEPQPAGARRTIFRLLRGCRSLNLRTAKSGKITAGHSHWESATMACRVIGSIRWLHQLNQA